MKKQRNHSQLKDWENSLKKKKKTKEIDLFNLMDTKFEKETFKVLKELRTIDRNADYH